MLIQNFLPIMCIVLCIPTIIVCKKPKILVLIIASDNMPVYIELQKIWRSYMHLDPEHIAAYFIKGDPKLSQKVILENDTIWSKTEETIVPGIINKTMLSLSSFYSRIKSGEFQYVLRTNLSSFYIFNRLLEYLEHAPRTKFYAGSLPYPTADTSFASGSGFIMSSDVACFLVNNKNWFINNNTTMDDVLVGLFLRRNNIFMTVTPRIDLMPIAEWFDKKDHISNNVFQCRIKNPEATRLVDDIYTQKELREKFYAIKNI